MKKYKKKNKRIISKILNIISIIVLIIFLYVLYNSNILPKRYYKIISITLIVIELIYTLVCIINKSKIIYLFNLIIIILTIGQLYIVINVNSSLNFLYSNFQANLKTDIYYFVVNNDSKYQKLDDINGKNVYYYKDTEDLSKLDEAIKEKVSIKTQYVDSFNDLILKLNNNENIILINSGSYESITENNQTYKDNTRILGQIEMQTTIETYKQSTKQITKDPFIIYLSGIDTRSNYLPSKSLSDVNMFIVVNPNTRKILLVNIPRDYYVQIHNTTGLKDKLTHAGAIGGVELSKNTIEDILGYDADYYIRVNFNAVVNLVDAIGGITVNSELGHSFTCHSDSSCVINPGDNNLNGKCALAFSRERYEYTTGDRHRGENQQQVIKKILDKVTSSTVLITNYKKILNSLSKSFESTLTPNDITSLVQFQINDMSSWDIETSNLDGTTGMAYTYSYPNQKLSVMYPNEETINTAKLKIDAILNKQ